MAEPVDLSGLSLDIEPEQTQSGTQPQAIDLSGMELDFGTAATQEQREQEIQEYEDQGGGIMSSVERGFRRANQSFNAAGAALGDFVMDNMPESVRESNFGRWLQEEADTDKRDVIRDKKSIAELPQRPEMARAVEAANNAESTTEAIKAFAKEVNDSPDTVGFLIDTLAEQSPQLLTMLLGTKGAGAFITGSGKASQMARMGVGGGISSASATFGPNTAEYMGDDIENFPEASEKAFKRTAAQAGVDAATSALIPVKIGPNQAVNVPAQASIQATGGAAGEYAGAKAVGEDPSRGELIAEGMLELIGAPGDAVAAYVDSRTNGSESDGGADAEAQPARDPVREMKAAEEAVTFRNKELDKAKSDYLKALKDGAGLDDIAEFESRVELAKNNRKLATDNLHELKTGQEAAPEETAPSEIDQEIASYAEPRTFHDESRPQGLHQGVPLNEEPTQSTWPEETDQERYQRLKALPPVKQTLLDRRFIQEYENSLPSVEVASGYRSRDEENQAKMQTTIADLKAERNNAASRKGSLATGTLLQGQPENLTPEQQTYFEGLKDQGRYEELSSRPPHLLNLLERRWMKQYEQSNPDAEIIIPNTYQPKESQPAIEVPGSTQAPESNTGEDRDFVIQVARENRARARYNANPNPNEDELLTAIAKSGGLRRDAAEGVDPADFNRRAGIMPIFKANGGMTMDEMAEHLSQSGMGWVSGHDDLLAKLHDSLSGKENYTPTGWENKAERDYEDRMLQMAQQQEVNVAEAAELLDLDAHIPEATLQEAAMINYINAVSAHGITDQEVMDIFDKHDGDAQAISRDLTLLALEKDYAQAEKRRGNEGAGSPSQNRENRSESEPEARDGFIEGRPLTETDESEIWGQPLNSDPAADPLLQSYTEQDLQQRDAQQEAVATAEREVAQQAENRAAADAERDDFVLTGSDRAADTAAARGQGDLLGAMPDREPPPSITGEKINEEWTAFAPESGTLNIPRSDMPQVKAEHRGALVNFLEARDVEHEQKDVDPLELKPTQAEFSPKKVGRARKHQGGDRSVLVSQDGHVIDGHHQWMAKREEGQPISVIELKAPAAELVSMLKEFPSSETDKGATPTTTADSQRNETIDDFGETLEGARKHIDKLKLVSGDLADSEIAAAPLSKLFPKSSVDEIENKDAAAFMFAARSEIPSKPRVKHKLARWIESVKAVRELVRFIDTEENMAGVMAKLHDNPALRGFANRVELLQGIDRKDWGRVEKLVRASGYRYIDGEKIESEWVSLKIDGKTEYIDQPTVELALPEIRAKLAEDAPEVPKMAFEIRGRKGSYFINKKGDREYRRLKDFDDLAEARRYLNNHNAELVKAWEAIKVRDNVKKSDVRSKGNRKRTGSDYRKGADISPEEFSDTFGFRGVQFGKWVSQGKGSKDRQGLLNQTYDALMDLSTLLGIPPQAVSLNGSLGLAFGARGSGGFAAAHYEPGTVVINLTKPNGAGSLAHEWFHALDHYFSLQRDKPETGRYPFITFRPEPLYIHKTRQSRPISRAQLQRAFERSGSDYFNPKDWERDPNHPAGVRPEVETRFADLVEALDQSPMKQRALTIDKGKEDGYWSRIIERAARSFENYVIAKMNRDGYHNDFLANVVPEDKFVRADDRYPYLTADELAPVEEAFDGLFNTIETKKSDKGVVLFSRLSSGENRDRSGRSGSAYSRVPDSDRATPALTIEETADIVESIVFDWEGAPEIVVAATERDLPQVIIDEIEEANASGETRGVYFDGTAYVVAENVHSRSEVEEAVFHEVLGHYGIRKLFGRNTGIALNSLYRQLGGEAGVIKMAKQFDIDLKPYLDNDGHIDPDRRDEVIVDELLAHIAEQKVEYSWFDRLMVIIKKKLRQWGFKNIAKYGKAELAQLVSRARESVVRGQGEAVDGDGRPMLSQKGRAGSDRTPWGDFPEAVFQAGLGALKKHSEYAAAKGGDDQAAARVVKSVLSDDAMAQIKGIVGNRRPVVVPVLAQEASGANMLPLAYAYALSSRLGYDVDSNIIQSIKANHTDSGAFHRIGVQPVFDGEVIPGQDYIVVDDTMTMGGTLANLRGHIEANGGNVVLVSALTGHPGATKIAISDEQKRALIAKHGDELNDYLQEEFGFGIDSLTQGEAGHLRTSPGIDAIRERISEAQSQAGVGQTENRSVLNNDSDSDKTPRFKRTDSTGFAIPDETLTTAAIRKIADKYKVLKDLQHNINDTGRDISEDADAYRAEELFHGKTEEDLRQLRKSFVEPLAQKMAKFGIEQPELDQYLYAKHAQERNAHIAGINPDMPDGGSGMTNAAAMKIIKRVHNSGQLEQYEQLANIVYDMLATRRDTIRGAGLEDGGMLDAWESKYQFYVPLKGWAQDEKQEQLPRSGKGFNIGGKESKRALGRSSEAASPSSFAIQDLTETLIRKRKNEVGNAFLKLVEDNPNSEYWQIFTDENPEVDRRITKRADGTESVKETAVPMAMMRDRYFTTKRDGKTYYIKLEDERLMRAMKNVGPEQNSTLIRTLGAINRWLSALNTSYNPEFVIGNFARDIQTAVLNLSAEQSRDDGKAKGEKIVAQTVKDVPKAMRVVYRSFRDKSPKNKEWADWFDEFRGEGAKTGYFDMKSIDGQAKELQRLISMEKGGLKGMALKWGHASGQLVEDLNGAVENAVRLSAYVNARKAGISKSQAASLAKNMTVNFNRRGEIGTTLNALYMFANASIQGTMNFARTMIGLKGTKEDKLWNRLNTAQKISIGIMAGSYAFAMANRAGAGEDDDGENWYDKVPDYVKERNLVIMKSLLGGEQDGTYWKIPLPYGYNIFHVLGSSAEAVTNGTTKVTKAATDLALAALGSFSPIGFQDSGSADGLLLKNITPTLGKPVVDVAMNENFMGSSIYNENFPFGTPKPDSSLARRSTPEGYKAIAEFLNEVSGGSQWRSGSIDVNPDVMRYFINYYLGGAGKFWTSKVPDNVTRLSTGVETEPHKQLFLSRLHGKVLPYADQDKFYTRRDEINQVEDEYKALKGTERMRFYQDKKDVLRLRPLSKATEKRLRILRKRRDSIYAQDLPAAEQDERLKGIEEKMKAAVDHFNLRYKQITD